MTIKDTAKWREGSPTQHRLEQSYLGGVSPAQLMRASEMLKQWRAQTAPAQPTATHNSPTGTHNGAEAADTHNARLATDTRSQTVELPGELVPLVPEEDSDG